MEVEQTNILQVNTTVVNEIEQVKPESTKMSAKKSIVEKIAVVESDLKENKAVDVEEEKVMKKMTRKQMAIAKVTTDVPSSRTRSKTKPLEVKQNNARVQENKDKKKAAKQQKAPKAEKVIEEVKPVVEEKTEEEVKPVEQEEEKVVIEEQAPVEPTQEVVEEETKIVEEEIIKPEQEEEQSDLGKRVIEQTEEEALVEPEVEKKVEA